MCTRANMSARSLVFNSGHNTHWERTKGSHQTCSMARALRQTSNTVVQGQTDMNTLMFFFPKHNIHNPVCHSTTASWGDNEEKKKGREEDWERRVVQFNLYSSLLRPFIQSAHSMISCLSGNPMST